MPETSRIEYKQKITDDLEKEVNAFLNSHEGGNIYKNLKELRELALLQEDGGFYNRVILSQQSHKSLKIKLLQSPGGPQLTVFRPKSTCSKASAFLILRQNQ